LVPDHRVREISGASFEGFYYICFNQVAGTINGIYFHSNSQQYVLDEFDGIYCMLLANGQLVTIITDSSSSNSHGLMTAGVLVLWNFAEHWALRTAHGQLCAVFS
jgi:hypothetical protein